MNPIQIDTTQVATDLCSLTSTSTRTVIIQAAAQTDAATTTPAASATDASTTGATSTAQ